VETAFSSNIEIFNIGQQKIFVVDSVLECFPSVLIHAVNSKSVCKSRYSLEVKARFPAYFKDYQRRVLRGTSHLGQSSWYNLSELFGTQVIFEMCCRESWKQPFARMLYLQEFAIFLKQLKDMGRPELNSIGVPSFESWDLHSMREDLVELLDKLEMQNIDLYLQKDASNAL
jgi:hypothetical protein